MAKRNSKRPSRARSKKQSRVPKIEALSEEERREMERYEMTMRSEGRKEAIEDVVRCALIYDAETRRDDRAHRARQSKVHRIDSVILHARHTSRSPDQSYWVTLVTSKPGNRGSTTVFRGN